MTYSNTISEDSDASLRRHLRQASVRFLGPMNPHPENKVEANYKRGTQALQLSLVIFMVFSYLYKGAGETVRSDTTCTSMIHALRLIIVLSAALLFVLSMFTFILSVTAYSEQPIYKSLMCVCSYLCLCFFGALIGWIQLCLTILNIWYLWDFMNTSSTCMSEISSVGTPLFALSLQIYGWTAIFLIILFFGYVVYWCCSEPEESDKVETDWTNDYDPIPTREP